MLFKKGEQITEVDEEIEVDEENVEEDTEEMKPKKDWKKILKWGAIGGGTIIGAVIAGVIAKDRHDAAEAALWVDSMNSESDKDDEETEESDTDEKAENTAE